MQTDNQLIRRIKKKQDKKAADELMAILPGNLCVYLPADRREGTCA